MTNNNKNSNSEPIKLISELESHSLVFRAILSAIGDMPPVESNELLKKSDYNKTKTVHALLTINGKEFPISHFFSEMEKEIDSWLRNKAMEIIRDKIGKSFNDMLDKITNLSSMADELEKDFYAKLG